MKPTKGPSIAVMLGSAEPKEGGGGDSEMSLSEAKSRAEDAATAFAASLEMEGRDPRRILKAFRTLSTLCAKVEELEDSGETDDSNAGDDEDKGREYDAEDESSEE